MKYPFTIIECPCCGVERMQGQLEAIRPFEENKYQCPTCKTEIEIITEDK